MTDEEKKAIEFFEKSFKKKIPPYWYDDTISNIEEKIKTFLNLIEKQSKEIEELKEKYSKKLIEFQKEREWYEKNHISNDKIKAKIEELDKEEKEKLKGTKGQDRYAIKQEYMYKRCVLQSLLEKE